MIPLRDCIVFLERYAPPRLAETWDNVGLLVGDAERHVARVMTCLTLTPASVAEAVTQRADLVVSHHPLPFTALKRITNQSTPGRLLLELCAARIAVYSAHTAFDSAEQGINQRLAEGLGLRDIVPLAPHPEGAGTGRQGRLASAATLAELAARTREFLHIDALDVVGRPSDAVSRVAVACGAAGELVDLALAAGCDTMVLGEARFHTCLEAEAQGLKLLLPGHYATERFAQEALAEVLAAEFACLAVWASRDERDPLTRLSD